MRYKPFSTAYCSTGAGVQVAMLIKCHWYLWKVLCLRLLKWQTQGNLQKSSRILWDEQKPYQHNTDFQCVPMRVGGWEMHQATGSFIWGRRRSWFSLCGSASNRQLQIFIPLKSIKSGKLELLVWLSPSGSWLRTQNECNISCRVGKTKKKRTGKKELGGGKRKAAYPHHHRSAALPRFRFQFGQRWNW